MTARARLFLLGSVCVLLFNTSAAWAVGALKTTWVAPRNPVEQAAADLIVRSDVLADFEDVVSDELRLPHVVEITFGAPDGPLYDPEMVQIAIPYFFVTEVSARIATLSPDLPRDEREIIVAGVLEHTLYHELGHALVDLLDLRLQEPEEDAVDTLATIMMVVAFDDGGDAVLDAMEDFFALDRIEGELQTPSFFEEHSLDINRYRSGLCLVYGSDPAEHEALEQELGRSAARSCVGAWNAALERWLRHLKPAVRRGGQLAALLRP